MEGNLIDMILAYMSLYFFIWRTSLKYTVIVYWGCEVNKIIQYIALNNVFKSLFPNI